MSIRNPKKRKPLEDRTSLLKGSPMAIIPKEKQPRDRTVKGADPEAIIQGYANDYLRLRKIAFTHYSARVLAHGDESISGDPDNMIRMPIKGTPFCLMLNIEFKREGKDRRPNQVRKSDSFNSQLATKFEQFERLMFDMVLFHKEIDLIDKRFYERK